MAYDIIRFNNGHRWDGSEHVTNTPLSECQEQARAIYDAGLAERVEVRGPEDVLLFQWPRAVSAA
ncbi:hypothetical protein [Sphingobium yanoikuyae]|uniref:hypothetical protein n=1 Tax=Sphingobium yanoikuyae TaxID=13690 RepID=UPI0028AFCF83|nr:hypothetical protein [Sphingobium yanoikuyae]